MRLPPWLTPTRLVLVLLAVLLVAGATWAAAPLFVTTRADTEVPSGFATVVAQGPWQGADDFHFASGTALLLTDGEGVYLLRLEAFAVRNGPDLHLYLSPDPVVGAGAVDLGPLPATEGNFHVPVPAGTDVTALRYAIVYCVPFHVLFATAALA